MNQLWPSHLDLTLFHTSLCSLGFNHASLSTLGIHYISFHLRIFTHAFPSAWNASSLLHLANFWIIFRSLLECQVFRSFC